MANTTSAKKAVRKIARRTAINKSRRSSMRTMVRKVEDAIAGGDRSAALAAMQTASPVLLRAAQTGVIH
jgi:small subunit ribosomal protein S20